MHASGLTKLVGREEELLNYCCGAGRRQRPAKAKWSWSLARLAPPSVETCQRVCGSAARPSEEEALQRLEQRAGPKARKMLESFLAKVEKLERSEQ